MRENLSCLRHRLRCWLRRRRVLQSSRCRCLLLHPHPMPACRGRLRRWQCSYSRKVACSSDAAPAGVRPLAFMPYWLTISLVEGRTLVGRGAPQAQQCDREAARAELKMFLGGTALLACERTRVGNEPEEPVSWAGLVYSGQSWRHRWRKRRLAQRTKNIMLVVSYSRFVSLTGCPFGVKTEKYLFCNLHFS